MTGRIAFCTVCHTGSRYSELDEPCASCGRREVLAWEDPGQLELIPTKERSTMPKKNEAAAPASAQKPDEESEGGGAATLVEEVVASDVRTFATFSPTALEPDPRNPRGRVTLEGVADLLPKIKAFGQKVPCLVRPIREGRHMIVLGHRRTFIAEHLGSEVPCVVEKMSDDHALVLMLAEHDSQKHFRPFAEAEAIADLLAKGWNFRQVADALGKSVRWVALRSNLKNLSPKIREKFEKGKLDWPVEWFEDLARLTIESQEKLLGQPLDYVRSQRDLDNLLGKQFHVLGKATWDLADGTLVPKAGACVTCPKTSLRAPGLFDDADADPESPKALKEAVCRDSLCWQSKCDAVQKQKIAELRREHPGSPLVKEAYKNPPTPKGVAVKELSYQATVSAPKKGAETAILIQEDGTPKLVAVKERKSSSAKPKADPKKAPAKGEDFAKGLAASKKEIEARRAQWVQEQLAKRVETAPVPSNADVALAVIAAYGWNPDATFEAEVDHEGRKKLADKILKGKELLPDFINLAWPGVAENAADLAMLYSKKMDELRWLAELLEIDVAKLEASARDEIPDPKWWGKAEASAEKSTATLMHLTDVGGKPRCGLLMKSLEKDVTGVVDKVTCARCVDYTQRKCRGCKRTARELAAATPIVDWKTSTLCMACGGEQPAGKKKSKKA